MDKIVLLRIPKLRANHGDYKLFLLLRLMLSLKYYTIMIRSFRCKDTEKLFHDKRVRRFQAIEWQARKKLLYLHAADSLQALVANPGNRLEQLKGDRRGQCSIRINRQWRICFKWQDGEASDVEIVDYH